VDEGVEVSSYLGVRHENHASVSSRPADMGKTDASIPRSPLHDCPTWLQPAQDIMSHERSEVHGMDLLPRRLRRLDHTKRSSVLDTTTRVLELCLAIDMGTSLL
jgi:hypothetical protein